MRMIAAAICIFLPGHIWAQSTPVQDATTEVLVDALTPPPRPLTRGISPQLRQEDMPSIDLAVEFEFASFELTQEAKALLSNLAAALQAPALMTHRFRLAGHTDAVGSDEANDQLSLERANAVRRFLVAEHGIAPERLDVAGYGKRQLLFEEAPEDARNRRVEVSVMME
jgi:outer membrane protein OmpA-like peptidoglycan-associated protein